MAAAASAPPQRQAKGEVTIAELGVGNTPSIQNMLQHVGVRARLTRDPDELRSAERIILPGVGAWDAGCRALRERGLERPLREAAGAGVPILGICLGMQLLARRSEEGAAPGLGLVEANFRKFDPAATDPPLKVPHIGWSRVAPQGGHPLFEGFDTPGRFYFVHSYYATEVPDGEVLATTDYGTRFVSSYGHGHVMGVQFHPEKSHADGMRLFRNFAKVPHGA